VQFLSFDPDVRDNSQDKVRCYALQVLHLGLLLHGFNNAIKEGDGNRIFNFFCSCTKPANVITTVKKFLISFYSTIFYLLNDKHSNLNGPESTHRQEYIL